MAATTTSTSSVSAGSPGTSSRYNANLRKRSTTLALSDATAAAAASTGGLERQWSNNIDDYTLNDVYDDAAVIGSELEKIINNYGSQIIKDLMPKVIRVLELMESLTLRREAETEELNELRARVHSLEAEKTHRINERDKFEKELEEIEEKWKQETLKLITMVNKLKEENKRLNDTLNENSLNSRQQSDQLVIKQEELDYIKQIKEENLKLKEALRFRERDMELKSTEYESLQRENEKVNSTLLTFRRKHILAQNQIEKMVKTKAELECTIAEKDQQLNKIKEKLHIKTLSDDELTNSATAASREVGSSTKSQTTTKEQLDSSTSSNSSTSTTTSKIGISSNDSNNVIIYDAKDPNRPRFTLKELQKVLMEKNELTVRLDQTQDELDLLKKQSESMYYGGEVQGPINKEPDEKLMPASGEANTTTTNVSGIRRFFGFFFESINSIGTSINETGMGSVGGGGQVKDPISGEIIDLGANEHVGRERASTTAVATNGQVFIA